MNSLNKYWSIFNTQIVNNLAYPGELLGRSLMIVPFMWIFYQLWNVTYQAAGTTSISGLTLHDTLWYLMMAETIELGRPRLTREISDAVKDGSIAYLLNKPYDFLLYHLSTSLGETIFRTLLNAILGGAVVWWLVGPPPDPRGWPLATLAVVGSWLLNYCVTCMIGLLAFVAEDVAPFEWIYQKLAFIMGGLLIPLDFYPNWLRSIANVLPFSAMTYGPAHLFVDSSLPAYLGVAGLQAIWIVILGGLLLFLYRLGLAHLTVNGG